MDTIEDAYIEGTKRNFVEKGVYGDSYREDEKPILVVSMKAAWNVDETPYIEMSKKYNVDKKKIVSPNRCKQFEFNPVDVLNEEKDYKPRETKNKNPEGQVSFL